MLDQRQQRARRVILVGDHQSIHALSAGVEEVVGALGAKRDVSDQRKTGQALFHLADPFEAGRTAGEQVDDRYANGLLAHRGQGMMIAARDRFWREVAPEAPGVYCVIDCEDLFDGVELPALLAFFAKTDAPQGDTPPPLRLSASRSGLIELAAQVCSAREERGFFPVAFADSAPLTEAFRTVAAEHKRRMASPRSRRARYDLAAQGQRLMCHLSAFARVALAERGMESTAADLNGKSIHYFALNLREWRQITSAAEDGLLTLDPALPEQVERIVAQAVHDATPLYPVKPQMRLGFLEDLETLKCTASDPELAYLAGESYPLSTRTNVLREPGEKVVEDRHG